MPLRVIHRAHTSEPDPEVPPTTRAYHTANLALSACKFVNGSNITTAGNFDHTKDGWRLDGQKKPKREYNIQIQRDDVFNAPSSVACVYIPDIYQQQLTHIKASGNQGMYNSMVGELTTAIHKALSYSAKSLHKTHDGYAVNTFEIAGDFANFKDGEWNQRGLTAPSVRAKPKVNL